MAAITRAWAREGLGLGLCLQLQELRLRRTRMVRTRVMAAVTRPRAKKD